MTNIKRATAAAAMLLAGACQPAPALTLPEDPKERIATCVAVEALNDAEASPDQGSADGMIRMMQISLYVATSAADADSSATANQERGGQLAIELSSQNYASLTAPCREAYPAPYGPAAPLPADPLEAAYVCITAGTILRDAWAEDAPELSRRAQAVATRAEAAGNPLLANISESENVAAGDKAVLDTVRLAPIAKTVDACAVRYP